jgi:GNAT superfamily N-acetyltransferase
VRIDFLKNQPVFARRLAELCGDQWEHLYVDWDRAVGLREFELQRADGRLPLSLVAIEGKELLGMVSLIFNDLPGYEHLNPWLASLLVLPEHRKKGTGSRLVREAERLLVLNRMSRAYLFTESACAFFAKLGWTALTTTSCNHHPIVILTKDFPESESQGACSCSAEKQ